METAIAEAHWTSAISANFATPGDWSTEAIPGAGDDAILDASGMNDYTVTASAKQTVNSIQTAATATLAVTGGVFDALTGTGAGANAGAITVGAGATFEGAGTVDNTGSITLAGGPGAAAFAIAAAGLTLDGGGTLALGGQGDDQIHAAGASAAFTNTDDTIAGAGYLGQATLAISNDADGTIDATGSLVVKGGADTIVNDGLMESTSGGTLIIASSTVDDTGGGTISADNGHVDLQDTTVEGGTLAGAGTGLIVANTAGGVLDGTTQAVTLSGVLNVVSGSNLTVEGSITGKGQIDLYAGKGTADLIIGSAGATLSGKVILSNAAGNSVGAAGGSATLTNDGVIAGSGALGNAHTTLVNNAGGVIEGTGSTPLTVGASGGTVVNFGTIEATDGAQVTIEGVLANSNKASSTLLASNGGVLTVMDDDGSNGKVKINGGTVHFVSGFQDNSEVIFTDGTGELVCYGGTGTGGVFGFSTTGGTKFDFTHIPFESDTVATYSQMPNTPNEGGLSVSSDAVGESYDYDVAVLFGNYSTATFVCSNDGNGGTLVQCEDNSPDAARPVSNAASARNAFVSAAAALVAPAGHPCNSAAQLRQAASPALATPSA